MIRSRVTSTRVKKEIIRRRRRLGSERTLIQNAKREKRRAQLLRKRALNQEERDQLRFLRKLEKHRKREERGLALLSLRKLRADITARIGAPIVDNPLLERAITFGIPITGAAALIDAEVARKLRRGRRQSGILSTGDKFKLGLE